jgi:hypothetical protein
MMMMKGRSKTGKNEMKMKEATENNSQSLEKRDRERSRKRAKVINHCKTHSMKSDLVI